MLTAHAYLDYNASSPLRKAARDVVPKAMGIGANPSSSHRTGAAASAMLEDARQAIADTAGCRRSGVVICSGATEANNTALRALTAISSQNSPAHLIISATEHPSVTETAKSLGAAGACTYSVVGVGRDGLLDTAELSEHVAFAQGLGLSVVASVAGASGETGAIHDVRTAADIVHRAGGLMHSDCAQLWGRAGISDLDWDCATVSGHKIGGLAGAGALLLSPNIKPSSIPALVVGGGQEGGARAGTPNLLGAMTMAAAACEAYEHLPEETQRLRGLRDLLASELRRLGVPLAVLGPRSDDRRLPNTLVTRLIGADADAVLARIAPRVSASSRSACSSGTIEPPPALVAMGLDRDAAYEVLRFSMGHGTTETDVLDAAEAIADGAAHAAAS